MKSFLTLVLISFAWISWAQTPIYPTSDTYSFDLVPFQAEYLQMGSVLTVHTSRSADGIGYNVVMIMPDLNEPSRVSTDVIGISAKDGSFSYRDFGFALPARSIKRVEFDESKLSVATYSSSGNTQEEIASSEKVFDGTFVYWQLAGISRRVDSFTINRWRQTPEQVEAGMSAAAFVLDGKEDVSAAGKSFRCRRYTAEAGPDTKIICYVAEEAPYLIRQTYQQGDAEPMAILELSKLLE